PVSGATTTGGAIAKPAAMTAPITGRIGATTRVVTSDMTTTGAGTPSPVGIWNRAKAGRSGVAGRTSAIATAAPNGTAEAIATAMGARNGAAARTIGIATGAPTRAAGATATLTTVGIGDHAAIATATFGASGTAERSSAIGALLQSAAMAPSAASAGGRM